MLLPAMFIAGSALAGDEEPPAPAFESIICWGGSDAAVCGVPVIPNNLSITSVSLGIAHGVARLSDGSILLWGDDGLGQATVPTLASGVTFSAVSAGSQHNFALLSDGSVTTWGADNLGQLGLPDLGGFAVLAIGTGENHNLAIRLDGVVVGSGLDLDGQANPPVLAGAASFVDGGSKHSAALLDDGTVAFWGSNEDGAFNLPALAEGETYTSVACGRDFTVALKSDGTVVAAGNSEFTTVPATPATNTPISVHARYSNAAFVTDGELVVVWGDDANEQLTPPNLRPYQLKSIAVGQGFLVADVESDCDENDIADRDEVVADPTLDCDGNGELDSCTIAADPTLDCNENGILDSCDVDGDEELDCDGNGRFDSCEIEEDADLDCDEDGVLDSCQIAEDGALDCNEDGALDSCDGTGSSISSTTVSPIGPTSVVTATGTGLADPILDVRIEITIRADLGGPGEYMILRLNDTIIDYVYTSGGSHCPTNQDVETIMIEPELWKALAPDGDVELTLSASPLVSNLECASSNARISATWLSGGADCNNNEIPDFCEMRDGDVPDLNENDIPDTCEFVPRDDLDGDRKGDLVWWNGTSRKQVAWFLSGTTLLEEVTLGGGPDPGFTLVTTGDFDGDGQADLLYRDRKTNIRVHLMNGTSVVSKANVASGVQSVWTVLGTPDLNGDGNSDVIFYNTSTEAVNGWIMNGMVRGANGLIDTATGLRFDGFGDLDGDGDDDLLWRNADGEILAWIMAGLTATEEEVLPGTELPIATWRCEGLADFDGDFKADIVWRKKTNGLLYIWFMDGVERLESGQVLPEYATRYSLEALVDTNGDMKSDLVWRDTSTGDVFVWIMDGLERTSDALVRRMGLGWKLRNMP